MTTPSEPTPAFNRYDTVNPFIYHSNEDTFKLPQKL
jgi:hypothetical protein